MKTLLTGFSGITLALLASLSYAKTPTDWVKFHEDDSAVVYYSPKSIGKTKETFGVNVLANSKRGAGSLLDFWIVSCAEKEYASVAVLAFSGNYARGFFQGSVGQAGTEFMSMSQSTPSWPVYKAVCK